VKKSCSSEGEIRYSQACHRQGTLPRANNAGEGKRIASPGQEVFAITEARDDNVLGPRRIRDLVGRRQDQCRRTV
jgi:hypothetical protein